MANSKYEYVKAFEQSDALLPHTWIVIRVDGRGFTRFAQVHDFEKPNDEQALFLMNECAKAVFEDIPDIVFGYGLSEVGNLGAESLELSEDGGFAVQFCFEENQHSISTTLKGRSYSMHHHLMAELFATLRIPYFEITLHGVKLIGTDLRSLPVASLEVLLEHRLAGHINNQYNSCYWNLVKSGSSTAEAQAVIKGTLADFKNELLYTRFQINYSELPAIFRKGSLVFRRKEDTVVKIENGMPITRKRSNVVVVHEDMIKDTFWNENPSILNVGTSRKFKSPPLKERDGSESQKALEAMIVDEKN